MYTLIIYYAKEIAKNYANKNKNAAKWKNIMIYELRIMN